MDHHSRRASSLRWKIEASAGVGRRTAGASKAVGAADVAAWRRRGRTRGGIPPPFFSEEGGSESGGGGFVFAYRNLLLRGGSRYGVRVMIR